MSNITNNRINVVMTAAEISKVKDAIIEIKTQMPFLIGLNVDERIQLPKISVANKAFTEDAINAVSNNRDILPAYIDPTTMQNDLTLYNQCDEIASLLRQILERVDDTQMLAGSEAYVAALTAYKLFGAASDAGLAGSDSIYDQLKVRFAGQGNNTTTTPVV
jgi:hypothetical protein